MKKIINIKLILASAILLSSCILEEDEPDYDVVGGVASIAALTPSDLSPEAGQSVTVNAVYYSEHVPATELRFFAKIGTASRILIETVSINSYSPTDSFSHTFDYTIPNGTEPGTIIIFSLEVETHLDFFTTFSTPNDVKNANTVITI